MSRGFQVSRQTNRDIEFFRVSTRPVVPGRTHGHALDLDKITHEETVKLVRRLFFLGPTIPHVVIFSGVEHGSGCSWVCARAADVLAAHVDGSVCLVDADFRSPSLHRYFDVEDPASGQRPGKSNLWLLSNAFIDPDWQAPLSLDHLQSRISDLRASFTHILVDAPPINAYADATLLGNAADGLVMILEANNTHRDAAMSAKQIVTAAGIRLLGAVLNKRTFPIPERLYRKL